MNLDFKDLQAFADFLEDISSEIGFKVSARGWAYILEQKRYVNKDEFDKVNNTINRCRKKGILPIDFTAEEDARAFKGVEYYDPDYDVIDRLGDYLRASKNVGDYYTPDWWDQEEYYIQMLVEKVDLVTLFYPVCREYHIPIANSKGWSSMLQRAEYARRFKEAKDKGLKCVLLYCGDHDPDGLRISEFLRKNLADLKDVSWEDGEEGYNPSDLIIDRFGLNFDFIQSHGFTWIDNLITGSKKNLADPGHRNYHMGYVQDYLNKIGERKCEANAIVTLPDIARDLARESIEYYVGPDAKARFKQAREEVKDELRDYLDDTGVGRKITKMIIDIASRDKD